ncbi:Protein-tyrosine-phosphatase [metagenome]|uniref:protein-tyrosine-phosphatase n=1 Tax=metagenome TaxID=256318 RepID=A0A2P2BYM3_9ZZZZ
MDLPAQRGPGPYRIAVVCLGNICRSPMAEVVLRAHLERAGLAGEVAVDSSGTGGWHLGSHMDSRAADTLTEHGYDASRHSAAHFTRARIDEHDLVLAMDSQNLADLRGLGVGDRLRLFRDFDPEGSGDVPDPYYGGTDGFTAVLAMVERTTDALVSALKGRP